MCDCAIKGIKTGFTTAWTNVKQAAEQGKQAVSKAYNFVGTKIEKLAHDHLPPTAAKIVSAIVWSSPFAIVSAVLPGRAFEIITGIAMGAWKTFPHEIDNYISRKNREHVFDGIAIGAVVQVARDVVKCIATRNLWLLVPIIFNVFAAVESFFLARTAPPEETEKKDLSPLPPQTAVANAAV